MSEANTIEEQDKVGVFQCSCGGMAWFVCTDGSIECIECRTNIPLEHVEKEQQVELH